METNDLYDLKSVKLPYLAGITLKIFVLLLESPLRGLLVPSLFKSAGIDWVRKQYFEEDPTHHPIHFTGEYQKASSAVHENELPGKAYPNKGFQFASVFDFARAYRCEETTPEEVAEKVLESIAASDSRVKPLKAFIAVNREDVMRQAHESAERIKAGKPLSVLDGVPVAIKDEVDMVPYPTTAGTAFLGTAPAREDSTVVAPYADATAPAGALSYLVRAENDETCSSGPANSGVTDANAKYVTVEQTTTRPVPLALDTLQVALDNHVHVRLDWTAVPAATAFRVYRSSSPVPGSFALLGTAAGTTYEDLAQGLDPETRFYLVRGVNACGQEGP